MLDPVGSLVVDAEQQKLLVGNVCFGSDVVTEPAQVLIGHAVGRLVVKRHLQNDRGDEEERRGQEQYERTVESTYGTNTRGLTSRKK